MAFYVMRHERMLIFSWFIPYILVDIEKLVVYVGEYLAANENVLGLSEI